MNKTSLLLMIFLITCSSAFAMPKAGTIGIEGSNFIIADPIGNNMASGIGYLTYNFTNDLSGGIAISCFYRVNL